MYIDEEIYPIEAGDQILVPAGTKHNIKNTGKNPLVLVFTYPSVKVTRTFIEQRKIAKNIQVKDLKEKEELGSCNITKLVNVTLSNMSTNVDMLYLKRYSRIYRCALYHSEQSD